MFCMHILYAFCSNSWYKAERVKTFRALFLETSQPKYVKIVHLLLIKRYFVSFVIFGTNYQYNLKHFDEKRKMGIMVPKQFLYEENKTSQFKILTENIRKGV